MKWILFMVLVICMSCTHQLSRDDNRLGEERDSLVDDYGPMMHRRYGTLVYREGDQEDIMHDDFLLAEAEGYFLITTSDGYMLGFNWAGEDSLYGPDLRIFSFHDLKDTLRLVGLKDPKFDYREEYLLTDLEEFVH